MAESATYASISWPPSYGTPALLMNASGADKTGGITDSARGSSRNYQVISALIGVDSEALAPPSPKLREFHFMVQTGANLWVEGQLEQLSQVFSHSRS